MRAALHSFAVDWIRKDKNIQIISRIAQQIMSGDELNMSKVILEKDGRIGRIFLNRPEKLNAIDDDVPDALQDAVLDAEKDPGIHVIILAGKGQGVLRWLRSGSLCRGRHTKPGLSG